MAVWQVTFQFIPKGIVDEFDILPAEILHFLDHTGGPLFSLPPDYAQQVAGLLPPARSFSDEMELWGDDKHDDLSISRNRGEVFSIEARIDVRKLDSVLLSGLLALADSWACILVETRYRKVCRMGLEDFRAFLAGHPHCRAVKEPDVWFPVLADEVKRAEGEP